jgi:DNA-binding response OmpR family regulator
VRERGAVRILLVEDDDGIALPLVKGLEREGYEVDRVANGAGALAHEGADLVLLDLRLPDLDGFEVCRRLRSASTVPIIVVSARGEEADRVIGLESGADDYIAKPFSSRELVARVRAHARRARGLSGPKQALVRAGKLELDPGSRAVTFRDRELSLTTYEFDLLKALVACSAVSSSSASCAAAPTTRSIARSTCTSRTCARSSTTIRRARAS